jgi:hypothetical protein
MDERQTIPVFIKNRILAWFDDTNRPKSDEHSGWGENKMVSTYEECNLITSQLLGTKHLPVLDFDFECRLVPSRTPGNYHLYINKEVEWDKYAKMLVAMRDAGVLQDGYVASALHRGYTGVRKPKENNDG